MRLFGLIGFPLSHSFSKKYFGEKFQRESITDAEYRLFEIDHIGKADEVFALEGLRGLNVTIPYKEQVIPRLHELDPLAARIGAVNVIRIGHDGIRTGFNSDYYGFRRSLESWLGPDLPKAALILGTGGAAKAVQAALEDLGMAVAYVSRQPGKAEYTYADLHADPAILTRHRLLINSTPLGMAPDTGRCPDIPFDQIGQGHCFYDLIYNPGRTLWMAEGENRGARAKNGLDMLELQAEKSWEIWNA